MPTGRQGQESAPPPAPGEYPGRPSRSVPRPSSPRGVQAPLGEGDGVGAGAALAVWTGVATGGAGRLAVVASAGDDAPADGCADADADAEGAGDEGAGTDDGETEDGGADRAAGDIAVVLPGPGTGPGPGPGALSGPAAPLSAEVHAPTTPCREAAPSPSRSATTAHQTRAVVTTAAGSDRLPAGLQIRAAQRAMAATLRTAMGAATRPTTTAATTSTPAAPQARTRSVGRDGSRSSRRDLTGLPAAPALDRVRAGTAAYCAMPP